MVKVWLIECDFCGVIIDALKAPFWQEDENAKCACEVCYNKSETTVPVQNLETVGGEVSHSNTGNQES